MPHYLHILLLDFQPKNPVCSNKKGIPQQTLPFIQRTLWSVEQSCTVSTTYAFCSRPNKSGTRNVLFCSWKRLFKPASTYSWSACAMGSLLACCPNTHTNQAKSQTAPSSLLSLGMVVCRIYQRNTPAAFFTEFEQTWNLFVSICIDLFVFELHSLKVRNSCS